MNQCAQAFRNFFNEFREPAAEGGERPDPKYQHLLYQTKQAMLYNLNIDCRDIKSFDPELYAQLVRFPQEVIPIFDLVVHNIYSESWPDEEEQMARRIQVRTTVLGTCACVVLCWRQVAETLTLVGSLRRVVSWCCYRCRCAPSTWKR